MVNALSKLLGPLKRATALMVARGVVKLVNDAGGLQVLQLGLLAEEVRDGIPRAQNYGFTANPLPGAQAVIVCPGGNRNKAIAIAVDDPRHRLLNLQPGEVAIYTDEGDYIKLARGRIMQVVAGTKLEVTAPEVDVVASTKVTITSPLTAISQNVTVGGTLAVTGQITGQGGLAVSGGNGAQVAGNVTVTGGDVKADAISLKNHVHGSVQPGSGTTGAPQ